MYKDSKFSGNPIISQVINLLDLYKIRRTAKQLGSDKYYKTFTTEAHLKTMLYMVLSGCNSLREICGIFLACEGRINHLGMKYFLKRSTISDANRKRKSQVFCNIYMLLLNQYSKFLSDSRLNKSILKNLNIIDSTTIGLQNKNQI